jgi:hypothetical protein
MKKKHVNRRLIPAMNHLTVGCSFNRIALRVFMTNVLHDRMADHGGLTAWGVGLATRLLGMWVRIPLMA